MSNRSGSRIYIGLAALLVLACLAVYGQTLGHDFINFDDDRYVTANPHVLAGLTRAGAAWAFTTHLESNWHPLTWLSHMLDAQLYGANPTGHHLTALLLHTLSALLLFLLLSRMTGYPWRSAFVAALFAVHPLHVESVAWIAERKDTLSTFFWMLTALAYVAYARQPRLGKYLLVVLLYALGLMAKPMLVSLPLALLLLDYWPIGRLSDTKLRRLVVLEKLPLFALAAVSCVITFVVQQQGGSVGSSDVFPLGVRIANAVVAYVGYLVKMVWPQHLAIFYIHPGHTLPLWQVIGSALVLVAITCLAVWQRKKRPYLVVGWLWYLLTLVPVIGLVQVGSQAMADRYTYVPLIGVFVMIAWWMSEFRPETATVSAEAPPRRKKAKAHKPPKQQSPSYALAAVAVAIVVAFAIAGFVQANHWKNSITLFSYVNKVTERNALAQFLLGSAYEAQGDKEQAVRFYAQAVDSKPKYVEARNNLGLLLEDQGRRDEAILQYRTALAIKPDRAEIHNNLGLALAKQGELDEAVRHYEEAVRLKPQHEKPQCNLGFTLARLGIIDEAIVHYKRAIGIKPDYADAHCYLGLAYARTGRVNDAIAEFRRTLQIDPAYAEAYNDLAVALYFKGEYAEAWRQIRLCREHGVSPPPAFIQVLSEKMPEPVRAKSKE